MHRYLIIALLNSSFLMAGSKSDKSDTNTTETKRRLPALEILPSGSILKKISIPRYNKNYSPSSLLTADLVEVISDDEIRGSNVAISLYDEAGKIKTRTKLNTVNFDQQTGRITSKENLIFSEGPFTTSSQGLILDWKNHCGFLLGKNQTIIYLKVTTPMTNPTSNTPPQSVKNNNKTNKIAATSIATAALIASPTTLSAQDIAEIDKLSQPSTTLFIKQLDDTKATLAATAEAEAKIAVIKKELTEQIGTIPKIDANQPPPAELVPVKGKEFIKITSDRLMFDAKKGIFVYYGNVKITHPKYSFTCEGELKIILSEAATAKKLKAEDKAKLKPNDLFDDLSQIIATNNVIVIAKDNKGRPVTAVTQNLNFNKATGNIILKGKGSRITTPDGQLKVITQNGYLILDQDMNASGVGTATNFVLPGNAKKP